MRDPERRGAWRPVRKMRVALAGMRHAILADFSVAYKVVLSVPGIVAAFLLREWIDFGILLVATGTMIAAEVFNTVVESLCDYIQPEPDERIGRIKDAAAAAAGVGILVWLAVTALESFRLVAALVGN